ncbi:MAG TPA: HEAT repeat domain-containing protein [Kofleriaceae bacterium]|nr:HEAT repeat domain-containing protein [Kofleriaceae bacterium]
MLLTIALAITVAPTQFAFADNVDQLSKALASSSEKTRVAAVTSLARLNDKSALKPLVTALKDPSVQVRVLAAAALGQLGHKAALPALRTASTDDPDDKVKATAKKAAAQVAKANGIADEPAAPPVAAATTSEARSAGRPGFGRQGHAVASKPDLYVMVKSSTDDSPGKYNKDDRKAHSEIMKRALATSLGRMPTVTMAAADATRWGLDLRNLDLSVVKLEMTTTGNTMKVEAQLRLAISDDKGRMMSFVSGGAIVEGGKGRVNPAYFPNLRKEALENAMQGLVDKLVQQLRRPNA